jgi:hypothetical protein
MTTVSCRVPIGKRAYFEGTRTTNESSSSSGSLDGSGSTVTVDTNGYHEIREPQENVGSSKSDNNNTTKSSEILHLLPSNSLKQGNPSVICETTNDDALFARLEELELKEQAEAKQKAVAKTNARLEASSSSTPQRDSNYSNTELTALKKRMEEIKSIDNYDEVPSMMKELKQLRTRHRTITSTQKTAQTMIVNPQKTSAAPTSPSAHPPHSSPSTISISSTHNSSSTTDTVQQLKQAGNKAFKDKDYGTAISQYTAAMAADTEQQHLHVLLSNRSLTFLKSRFYSEAERDAERITEIRPLWAKGYYRYATAVFEGAQETGKTADDALRIIERGLSHEPTNKALLKLKIQYCSDSKVSSDGDAARAIGGSSVGITAKKIGNDRNDAFSGKIVEHQSKDKKKTSAESKDQPRMSAFRRRRLGLE